MKLRPSTMKNKILILSPFFYPEPISTGKYNTLLAKEFLMESSEIDVLCCHPLYPTWVVEKSNAQLTGINAIRGGAWLKLPKNMLLRRSILETWFLLFVFSKLVFSTKKYSHIVPVFPPSLFMLLIPFLKKRAKLVGIVHDLQGVYAHRDAGFIKKIIYGAIKWVEKRAFQACDKLIFLSEDMMKVSENEYNLAVEKNTVHYPFVTVDKFENNGDLKHIIVDGQKSIVYAGALGEKQAPYKLAEFMREFIKCNTDYKAYIFSQGPIFDHIKGKYPTISFNPLVDEEHLPELLMRSTIQVLPQETGTSDGSLPSKLPNLLSSGCKILCITDPESELVRLLNSYSLALVCHSWQLDDLVENAQKLAIMESLASSDGKLLDKFTKSALVDAVLN